MERKKLKCIILMLMLTMTAFMLFSMSPVVSAGDVYNGTPTPANSTTYYPTDNVTVSLTITTKTGATLRHFFRTNISGTWTTVEATTGLANGTATDTVQGMSLYNSKYFWSSNLSNSNASREWDNNTYFFYTHGSAQPDTTGDGGGSSRKATFTVTDSSGKPVGGVHITVDSRDFTTKPNGKINVYLAAGEYKYTATGEGCDTKQGTLTIRREDVTVDLTMCTPTGGSTTPPLDIVDVKDVTTWSVDLSTNYEVFAFIIVLGAAVYLAFMKKLYPLNLKSAIYIVIIIGVLIAILVI